MLKPPPPIPGAGRKTKSGFEVFEGKRPREADEAPKNGKKNYQHETIGSLAHPSSRTPKYGTGKEIDETFNEHHLKTIQGIAQKHLGLDTLATRNSDEHDFKEHAVWGIHDALKAAFQAGRMAK